MLGPMMTTSTVCVCNRRIPHCVYVTPIPRARVPIVKFVHRHTGIHCDISFKVIFQQDF